MSIGPATNFKIAIGVTSFVIGLACANSGGSKNVQVIPRTGTSDSRGSPNDGPNGGSKSSGRGSLGSQNPGTQGNSDSFNDAASAGSASGGNPSPLSTPGSTSNNGGSPSGPAPGPAGSTDPTSPLTSPGPSPGTDPLASSPGPSPTPTPQPSTPQNPSPGSSDDGIGIDVNDGGKCLKFNVVTLTCEARG